MTQRQREFSAEVPLKPIPESSDKRQNGGLAAVGGFDTFIHDGNVFLRMFPAGPTPRFSQRSPQRKRRTLEE